MTPRHTPAKSAPGLGSLAARRPLLTLAAALLLGAAASAALRSLPPKAEKVTLTPVVARALAHDGAPRLGAPRPDVRIVVFTDYRCPVCRRTDSALERLMADDPGVQVVYRDWPILGPASEEAARVALAAHRQGGYLPVHRALMASAFGPDRERILDIAAAAGADRDRLERDLAAHGDEIDAQLARNHAQGWSLGLGGTPAYLVGPYLARGGLEERRLRRLVAEARKAGPPR
jgi:protein-disulfide isomerase